MVKLNVIMFEKKQHNLKYVSWFFFVLGVIIFTLSCIVYDDSEIVNKRNYVSGKWMIWGNNILILKQSGNTVTGNYYLAEGRIFGTLDGNTLTGTWIENESGKYTGDQGRTGQFIWIFSDDFKSFTGTWGRDSSSTGGGEWNGISLEDDDEDNELISDKDDTDQSIDDEENVEDDNLSDEDDNENENLPVLKTFNPSSLSRGGVYSFTATGENFKDGDYIYIKGNDEITVARSTINKVSEDRKTFKGEIEVVGWMPLGSCETLYYRPSTDYWFNGPDITITSDTSYPIDDKELDEEGYNPIIKTFNPSTLPRDNQHSFTAIGENFKAGDYIYIKGNDEITVARSSINKVSEDGKTFKGEIEVVGWMPLGSCETLYYRPSTNYWINGPDIEIVSASVNPLPQYSDEVQISDKPVITPTQTSTSQSDSYSNSLSFGYGPTLKSTVSTGGGMIQELDKIEIFNILLTYNSNDKLYHGFTDGHLIVFDANTYIIKDLTSGAEEKVDKSDILYPN